METFLGILLAVFLSAVAFGLFSLAVGAAADLVRLVIFRRQAP